MTLDVARATMASLATMNLIVRNMIRVGHVLFKVRDALFPVVFLALALGVRPVIAGGDEGVDNAIDALGVAIALSGQLLRAAVIGLAYIKRGGKNKRIYADSLVQEGLFAHSRNPLYMGNILIMIGLAVIHNSPWFYAVGVPFFVWAYLCIVLAEEQFLRGKFGDEYEDYCRRVNRFIPSPLGLRKSLAGMSFDWRKVIRKEYGTPLAWISAALGLMLWERVSIDSTESIHRRAVVLAGVWLLLAAAYAAARILKKAGKLGEG